MSKEKIKNLVKYEEDLKAKMTSPTPKKHESHPESYKSFLLKELAAVKAKIDQLRSK